MAFSSSSKEASRIQRCALCNWTAVLVELARGCIEPKAWLMIRAVETSSTDQRVPTAVAAPVARNAAGSPTYSRVGSNALVRPVSQALSRTSLQPRQSNPARSLSAMAGWSSPADWSLKPASRHGSVAFHVPWHENTIVPYRFPRDLRTSAGSLFSVGSSPLVSPKIVRSSEENRRAMLATSVPAHGRSPVGFATANMPSACGSFETSAETVSEARLGA